jgi:hypothetical protein
MARAYTRDDVIGAYLMRFIKAGLDISIIAKNAETYYDKVGKTKFREAASVTPEVMAEYFEFIN